MNVTATTYKPVWVEEELKTLEGEVIIRRSGMDYFLFETIAHKLNFTFKVIPITFWSEVSSVISFNLLLNIFNQLRCNLEYTLVEYTGVLYFSK